MLRRPVDGFTLVQDIYPALPYHQPSHALAQIDPWRRANSYRLLWVVVPDEERQTVPARGTVEYQAKIPVGSWWYGFTVGSETAAAANGVNVFNVGITDQATGHDIFSDVIDASQLNQLLDFNINGDAGGPILLEQPYAVTEPGLFNVVIYNDSPTLALTFQMVLNILEPCKSREIPDQECL